jgi:diguanylate cyclase (GGDEF)-like protein/hemerythrin-like metal-binding protein/PAS domain S-box-containing protein
MKSKKTSSGNNDETSITREDERLSQHKTLCTDKLFMSAFNFASIGMSLLAPDGRWIAVNNALCKLVGYTESELLSKKFQDITYPEDIDEDLANFKRIISHEIDTYQREKRYIHKNGGIIHVLLSVSLVRDDNDKPLFFISQAQDITSRKQVESELVRLANEDYLTGVNTRRRFFDFGAREIARGGRFHESMTVLMIDIDNFKQVNDTYGHDIGDDVLKCMALACKNSLREVDVFGRLGGDEFAAVLINTDQERGRQIAERLRCNIEKLEVKTEKGNVRFTVSIGAVTFTGRGQSLEQRLKQADTVLYEAKHAGRNTVKLLIDVEDLDDSFSRMQTGFIRLVWKDTYESGNDTIDSQHQELFKHSNELLAALIDGQPKHACEQLIKSLLMHVEKHFRDEADILKSAHYPDVEHHIELHSILVQVMERIATRFNNDQVSVGELFGFLAVDVVTKHMLEEDKKFFPYVAG